MEMQFAQYAEPGGGAASGVPVRGFVPSGDAGAWAQSRHGVVLGHRPRLAFIAYRLRALARPGEFRRRRAAASKPREFPADRRMTASPPPSLRGAARRSNLGQP